MISTGYAIGVMTMEAEGRQPERFGRLVEEATAGFREAVAEALGVRVDLLTFEGPHLVPAGGAYAPLDFLRIGLTEKLEREVHFLLVVTEVDLAATTFSYTLALPSQLTNVAVVSTKRLRPAFWGEGGEEAEDEALTARRLTALLLHCFGHLLNLPHHDGPDNAMHDAAGVEQLAGMGSFTDEQRQAMRVALPREAHERSTRGGFGERLRFTLVTLWRDRVSIGAAVRRAHPLRLLTRLPTMITAALSVILLLFFSPEPWDIASTVSLWGLGLFGLASVLGATAVLYRAFSLGGVLGRGRVLAESSVVTAAAVSLCLAATMTLLFVLFAGAAWGAASFFFPEKLMTTWPTVDPADRVLDHAKLALFIAGIGVLAGSLGGAADRKDLVRGVLFLDEET